MTPEQTAALKRLLLCLADDEYMLGHRMAEWTGMGPIIEEDIAFSSMAQDELGHALGFYTLLEEMGEGDPDHILYSRSANAFRNSILTELPRGDYAFSMMRQFLYDGAEAERLGALMRSAHEPLKDLARRMAQEERYHWMHGCTMTKRLAGGSDNARLRMQKALDALFPYALGLFESYEGEEILASADIAPRESDLRNAWLKRMCPLLLEYGLVPPARQSGDEWIPSCETVLGGRAGQHTEHIDDVLEAMAVLHKADPGAKW